VRNLIKKILKEEYDPFEWTKDLIPSGNYSPGTIYFAFGDNEEVRKYILESIVKSFGDLKLNGDKVIMETDSWCDFADLFYDDRRGSDGYINQYLAKQILCDDDGDWWEPYHGSDLIPNKREWKDTIWDDLVLKNEKVITEILNYIKKNYVSKVGYNPNQLDVFGELPEKQNVVEIKGRVLDENYFYELKEDLDILGDLINEEEEFLELKRELSWAYADAYNTAARDEIWKSVKGVIERTFGGGVWKQKEVKKMDGTVNRHYMEWGVTDLFWSTVLSYFDDCGYNYDISNRVEGKSLDEIEEEIDNCCSQCLNPAWDYNYFLSLYGERLRENGDEFNPRYQEWPDDDNIEKYFVESVMDRI